MYYDTLYIEEVLFGSRGSDVESLPVLQSPIKIYCINQYVFFIYRFMQFGYRVVYVETRLEFDGKAPSCCIHTVTYDERQV